MQKNCSYFGQFWKVLQFSGLNLATVDDFQLLFSKYSAPAPVKIVLDKSGGLGGFVHFDSIINAMDALILVNNRLVFQEYEVFLNFDLQENLDWYH